MLESKYKNKRDLVAVILLNYNQEDYTIKCVESILNTNYKDLIVMLVDNGSRVESVTRLYNELPDDSRLIFKQLKDNIGYSRGSNFAKEEAYKFNPKYFLIMNNDTILANDAIEELVKCSKRHNNKARVTGKVYHYNSPNKLQLVGYKFKNKRLLTFYRFGVDEVDNAQYEEEIELDMLDDIFVLQHVSLYEKIGGYSPYLFLNGVNQDLSLNAVKAGYKLIYTPKAKLWHKGSASIGGRNLNPKLAFWSIESKLIVRYLHLNKMNFKIYYLKTCFEILRTKTKAFLYKTLGKKNITKYADAKYKALLSFNKWSKNKTINEGITPY